MLNVRCWTDFQTMHHAPGPEDRFLTRRDFLQRCGIGFGALGLAAMLGPDAFAADSIKSAISFDNPRAPRQPPRPEKANRVIQICAMAEPSQVDPFFPKRGLTKRPGQPLPLDLKT